MGHSSRLLCFSLVLLVQPASTPRAVASGFMRPHAAPLPANGRGGLAEGP